MICTLRLRAYLGLRDSNMTTDYGLYGFHVSLGEIEDLHGECTGFNGARIRKNICEFSKQARTSATSASRTPTAL